MKKTLRILLWSVGGLIALVVALILLLPLLINPNAYRDDLARAVRETTGRELKIEDKLAWTVIPRLGIATGRIELANAPGFGKEPFAHIDAVGVAVEWLPLFTGRVVVDTLYMKGLSVNLAKNATGKGNWEDLAAPKDAKPAKPPVTETKPARDEAAKPPVDALAVGKLDIQNANLSYRDEQAGSAIAVRGLSLTTGRLEANKPFDLKLALELVRDKEAPIKIALDGHITAGLDSLKINPLRLALDDSQLTGTIDISQFAHPAIRFDLALDRFDLDRYLPKGGGKAAPEAKAAATASAGADDLPVASLRALDINGAFRAGSLKAFNLRLSDAQLAIKAKDGVIALGPNSAKAYGGSYRGEGRLDARGRALAVQIDESLKDVALDALLKDAIGIDKFRGTANISAKLNGEGASVTALKAGLGGNLVFGVKDGTIVGVDLKKFNDTLDAAIKAKSADKLAELKPAPGDQTTFTHLGGTAKVVSGVVRNDDLRIDAPGLVAVTGKGSADLVRESLDYTIQIGRLPVHARGPFAALSFKPDVKSVVRAEAAPKLEEKKEALRQKLKEKLKR